MMPNIWYEDFFNREEQLAPFHTVLFLSSTGMAQKENKFPRMVCRQTRSLHGLVTAPKPTKTTKTLIADGQPMTGLGLDCDIPNHLQQNPPLFSISLNLWLQKPLSAFLFPQPVTFI